MSLYQWKRINDELEGKPSSYYLGSSTDPKNPSVVTIHKTPDGWHCSSTNGSKCSTLAQAKSGAEAELERKIEAKRSRSTKAETWKAEKPASNDDAIPTPPLVAVTEVPTAAELVAWELGEIAAVKKIIDDQEDNLTWHVDRARRAGATWAQIGETLGLSLQGAHKRYGSKRPRKPGGGETPLF